MVKIVFPNLEISSIIGASSDEVWELLTDTLTWVDWGPSISEVQSSNRYIKKGSHGRIKTSLSFWVPFQVTDLDAGSQWSWRIYGIRATGHRIEPLHEGNCRLIFQVPIWAAPYLLVCKLALDRIAQLLIK